MIDVRGEGTIYRQKGSRYLWIQFFVNGKRHSESSHSDKKSVARKLLMQRRVEFAGKTPAANGSTELLIEELVDALIRDYSIHGLKSIDQLRGRWENHLKPYFAKIPAADLSMKQVTIYISQRQDEGAENASINREIAALKRAYSLAIESGKKLTPLKIRRLKEKVREGFLEESQYYRLAEATAKQGLWLRAMFEFAHNYGWRVGELKQLKVRQANFETQFVSLDRTQTKNGKARRVKMTARVMELLQQCAANKDFEEFLFTRTVNARGRKIRSLGGQIVDMRDVWQAACCEAGLGKMLCRAHDRELVNESCADCGSVVKPKDQKYSGLLFHDLRRTAVRNMDDNGVSRKMGKATTGHLTDSTYDRYNIGGDADAERVAATLDEVARKRHQMDMFARTQELFPPPLPKTGTRPN